MIQRYGGHMNNRVKKVYKMKQKIAQNLPPLTEVLRGTFIKLYQVCARGNCRCHKSKKYRHGPFYRVSFSKKGRSYHIYVPLKDRKKVKIWVDNYNKLWQGIENISALNIKLIQKKI